MPVLTMQILASLAQLHGPDATIQSEHKGLDELLGAVREELADNLKVQPDAPDLGSPYLIQVRSGGGSRGGGSRMSPGSPGASRAAPRGPTVNRPPTPGTRRPSATQQKPFARTIFRKGGYGKSVYGPKYKEIILD